MKDPLAYLINFKRDVEDWIESATGEIPVDPMQKVLKSIELSIDIVKTNKRVQESQKHYFEGGTYLARYFDGWGDDFSLQYGSMVELIRRNYY